MDKESLPSAIKVLAEQVYLFKKGVRPLVLYTINSKYRPQAERLLQNNAIDYLMRPVGKGLRINLFFGKPECLEALRLLVRCPVAELSPEQDFILGALLGYDLSVQCQRYCHRCALSMSTQKPA